ncbi:hypothetical protein ACTFIY_005831 [Dictyostelium cf. discoideum]
MIFGEIKNLCIEVKSSTIIKKDVNLLGTDLSYALIDVEFDQDIYLYDSLGCPNYNCTDIPSDKNIDCTCDYTDMNECPKIRDSSCTNACNVTENICNGEWTAIESDTEKIYTTSEDLFFRMKADSFGCKGLFLKVLPISGYGQVYINGKTPSSSYSRYSSGFSPERNMLFNICPSDNWNRTEHFTFTDSWSRDTYFLRIQPLSKNYTFKMIIRSNDVPSEPVDTSNCQPVSSDHICITTGEVVYGFLTDNQYQHYSFQVENAGFYYFNFPSIFQSTSIFISNEYIFPNSSYTTWKLEQDYENNMVLYLEPVDSTTPLVIYISVYTVYETDYSFSITNQGNRYRYSLGSLSTQPGTLALVNSVRLRLPTIDYDSAAFTTSTTFTAIYPQYDINPLWPVSARFIDSTSFNYLNILQPPLNTFKPKSFQVAFILSVGGDFIENYSTILESSLQFLGTIFDENNNPIDLTINFKEKNLECNNTEFEKVLGFIEKTETTLFNVSDIDELNNYRYSLDSLTISNAWIGCSNKALSLLQMETVAKNISTKYCSYFVTDPEWETDPCCSELARYYQCCNPSIVLKNVTQFVSVNKSLVGEQCSSQECTSSVLSDYGSSLTGIDDCAVPSIEPKKLELTSITVLRDCKSKLVSPFCSNDTDCNGYGNGECNLFSRTCIPDFDTTDFEYVKCVLSNLSPGTLFSLLEGSTTVNDDVVTKVFNNHIREDCIGHNYIKDRSTFIWSPGFQLDDCYAVQHQECIDESCITYHDTCIESIYAHWDFRLVSHVDNCTDWGICPYLSCNDNTYTKNGIEESCEDACVLKDFCGVCTNEDTQCHVATEFADQASCQTQSQICLLPNGEYNLTATSESDCNSKGKCSVPCGYECSSSLANNQDDYCAILQTKMNSSKCAALDNPAGTTEWSTEAKVCILKSATDEQQCTAAGTNYTWIDCSTKLEGECSGPLNNVKLCSLKPIECQSEQECLTAAGTCSDEFYFSSLANNHYPVGLGRCVFPHDNYQYLISCKESEQQDSPNGCYSINPMVLTQIDCEDDGGVWWIPARNQSSCTSQMGCKILESYETNLPYNFHFNEMDQETCEACIDSFNKWTNKFQWEAATWLPGVYKPIAWNTAKSFISNENRDVFNYQLFYKSVTKAAKAQVADLFRSEAYCRMERLQSNLNSITCSCSGEGGPQCFTASTPLLGQTKPCAGVNSSFSFDYGKVEFSNNSISQSCQSLSISQISREIYTSAQKESLASNFVSYKKADKYGVKNDNDAIIGTLLGDGIMIKSQDGINEATICLTIFGTNNSKYPIYDFAIQINDGSYDVESKTPAPIQSSKVFTQISKDSVTAGKDEVLMLCSIVTIEGGNPIYFPINRMDEWENERKQAFDSTSKALMYTLATFFLVVALWGGFELCLIAIARYKQRNITIKRKFQLTHLLIGVVTLFITIRAIYFFIMPSGNLSDSPIIDYILVVLPTFIYFTAFNILLVLWYVIVFLVLKKNKSADNLTKRLFTIVFVINAFLYILFIAIVLVFQYTKSNPTNDCGSRIVIPIESSTPQRVVSIVYAVIQALISLVMGAAFIYLGGRLFIVMRSTNIKVGSKSNHQRKIFILSFVCSIGFLLHCAFVLILVAGNVNSMIFSFIGLIITEIIPACSILFCFDQRAKNNVADTASGTTRGSSRGGSKREKGTRLSTMVGDSRLNSINTNSNSPSEYSNNDFESPNNSSVNTPTSIEVKSSTILKKDVNLLGTDLSYALIDVEFDQEVFKYDSLSCPNFACKDIPVNKNIDCTCDYTDVNECPKIRDPTCTNVCPTSINTNAANTTFDTICTGYNWTTIKLEENTNTTYEAINGIPLYFRMKANSYDCKGLYFKVLPISGYGKTSINGRSHGSSSRSSSGSKPERNMLFNICPSDSYSFTTGNILSVYRSWTNGTYFIAVTAITDSFKFQIQTHTNFVPTTPVTPYCQVATINHTCINLGQLNSGSMAGSAKKFYNLNIDKADFYYFNFPTLYQSTQIYMSDYYQYPNKENNTWSLIQDTENSLVLYLEPKNETTPLTIYIAVEMAFGSQFVFSVTTQGTKYAHKISDYPSTLSGVLDFLNSARLVLPSGQEYTSPAYSSNGIFSTIYPLFDTNPLWPVSSLYIGSSSFSYSSISQPILGDTKPKSFQVSFLLTKGSSVFQTYDTIASSSLQFFSNLFGEDQKPINLNVTFIKKEIECNNKDFQKIISFIGGTENTLFNVSDIDELNNYRYRLDSLTISDSWISCSNKALSLLQMETVVKDISTYSCPYPSTDENFKKHPCCSIIARYDQCCNPSIVLTNVTQFISVNKSLVSEQCSSLECTSSVLSDYGSSLTGIDDCAVTSNELTRLGLGPITVLRDCKSKLVSPFCTNDTDCNGYGNGTCNLFSRTCMPDFNKVDFEYVKCVLSNLSPGTLFSLLEGSTKVNDDVVAKVFNNHLSTDCIGKNNIKDRSTYVWVNGIDDTCYSALPHGCIDESCLTYHDSCLEGVYAGYWNFKLISNVDDCNDWGICPYLSCNDNTYTGNGATTSCENACLSKDFCGVCTNEDTQCHVVTEVTDQASCQTQNQICLLPNGEYDLTATSESDCSSKGKCSVPCGYECSSSLANNQDDFCAFKAAGMNSANCAALNNPAGTAEWSAEANVCILRSATTQQQCTTAGTNYTWIDCSSMLEGECLGPNYEYASLCSLKPIECQSEQECLTAGTCSDEFYFEPSGYYPFGYGKCVFKHTENMLIAGKGCLTSQHDTPNGCFNTSFSYPTAAYCISSGGVWWVPSRNQSSCTSQMGCKILESVDLVNNLPYNYYFNDMSEETCEGCIDSFNKWTNKFKWEAATWLPGVLKPVTWNTAKSFIPNENRDVFNYQLFYNSVDKAAKTQVADLFRSEAYCRMERLQSNLNSITCSCSGEGGPQCFTASTPLLGQTKPCAGVSSSFSFDYGKIQFTNRSISQNCQYCSISQISREIYTSAQKESLASNFVSYEKADKYGVKNSKGAIIGTLLGDGIMIKSQDGINEATICLVAFEETNDKYTKYDFAVQIDDESTPTPIQSNKLFTQMSNGTVTGKEKQLMVCSTISTIQGGNPIYFPINRMDEWENESKQAFDSTSRALMYTLAAFFLAVALWGMVELTLIGISRIKNRGKTIKRNFQLTHLLIGVVTLFITIRAIYFFIMPSGNLSDSPIADYILVVLPTFIYFTAFNILLVLWYVIVFLVLKKNKSADNLTKRLFTIVFVINAFLYLLFIAIVLVFQYTKTDPSNDCGSRIVISVESSTPQRVVSIVYAAIQALVSLVMGAAFIYLGGRLFIVMRSTNIKIGSKSNHQRKIFILSFVCSIGFLLHCVFVLILVAGNVNSMVFSFIGLVITEIVPACSILFCFDQRSKNNNMDGGTSTRGMSAKSGKGGKMTTIVGDSRQSISLSHSQSNSASPSEFYSNNGDYPNDSSINTPNSSNLSVNNNNTNNNNNNNHESFEVKSSTVVKKDVNVLGVDLSFALIDIEFDQDIYKYDSLGCPNYNCTDIPIDKNIDCTCDYTDMNECPKIRDPSCTNACNETGVEGVELCSGEWKTVEFDKQYNFESSGGKIQRFRVKADSFGCNGVFLKVTPMEGYGDTYIGSTPSLTYQRYSSEYKPQRLALFNICPSDNWDVTEHYSYTLSWTRDTYFINVVPQSQYFKFSLILHTNNVPNATVDTSNCQSAAPDHICITTGEIINNVAEAYEPQYYSFQVEKAEFYYFNFPCMYQNVIYYMSNSTQKPTESNSFWQLSEDFENYIVLYLEPSTIYITAVPTYSTNYTFSITTQGDRYRYSFYESNFMTTQAGAISLVNTARLDTPTSYYDGPTFDASDPFTILYPQTDINPLYPVPSFFFHTPKFDYLLIYDDIIKDSFSSYKPKSFQASVRLSSSVGKNDLVKVFDFETILNSKLQFLSNIFDENDKPVNIQVGFKEKEIECDTGKFQQVLELLENTEKVLFNVSDIDELNNYRYSLDSLTISDAWIGCSNKALSLLHIETVVKNISIRLCQYSITDPEYKTDPCCSPIQDYYQCCNPSIIPTNITQFVSVNQSLVGEQCSSQECTSSVLSDYGSSLDGIDDCAVPSTEPTRLDLTSITVLRDCKSKLTPPTSFCTNDTDCNGYGDGICNLYSRTCMPNFNKIDFEYVKCVLSSLSPGTLFSLLESSTIVNDDVVTKVFNNHLKDDCIGQNDINERSTYTWGSRVSYSKEQCYSTNGCLDGSCLSHHDTCLDSMFLYWDFRLVSHFDNCTSWGICPYLSCKDNTYTENGIEESCEDACVLKDFCGVCTNEDTQCHVATEFADQASCQTQSQICLLPNGEYNLTATSESDCNSKGKCSVPCGYECSSSLANNQDDYCAILQTGMNSVNCAALDNPAGTTEWSAEANVCILKSATDEQQCTTAGSGYTWIDCSTKLEGECIGPDAQQSLCSLKPIECQSEQECLTAGTCSDEFYFNQATTRNYNYPEGYGKCLFPHGKFSGISCEPYAQQDSPNGCYPLGLDYLSKVSCEDDGGVWWIPARNQSSCTSQMGCKILESTLTVNNLPFNYQFNEMDQDLCEGCMDSFNKWTNKFQWEAATWLPGVYKPIAWNTAKSFIPNDINSVFNYQLFYKSVTKAAKAQVADLFRSEAYCRMERLQSNLDSITCSCSGEGGSQCFTASTPLLGQTKPCAGVNSSFSFDYGKVEFSNNSISQSCQSLSISQISREIYTSAQKESLASNFVSYKKADKYGVKNSKGAIIGTLLGDGIMIKSQDGINEATICLKISLSSTKYPILDFAVQIDGESTTPTPIQSNKVFTQISKDSVTAGKDEVLMLCSIVTIEGGNPIYFPINRMDEWENESKQAFDSTSRALMYTLGALFSVVSIWGLFELFLIARTQFVSEKRNFQLTHLLIGVVTLFITIRAIYFFIMPSGNLSDSPIADYILVVLPTFIYFTAFNILLVLWYVIVFLVLKKNKSAENLSKRLFTIVFVINAFLYLLFIAIVLVFQYTKTDPSNDCGSRIVIPVESSTPQRVVSIVYAVIQALISLIMGAAFIYLGGRLFIVMRSTNIKVGSKSNHQRKIFTLTVACSIGFLLHCVFVLILVAGNVNSMIFSFIGLIITEIVPGFSILYCFEQRARNINTSSDNSPTNSGGSKNRNSTKLSTMISDSRQNSNNSNSNSPSDYSNNDFESPNNSSFNTPNGNDEQL